MIHPPAVAGTFYPADPAELRAMVDLYIDQAKDFQLAKIQGIVAPHAGYIYSGATAGVAYRQFKNLPQKKYRIFLLGPSHHAYISASVGNYESYMTPLGAVPVDQETCRDLLQNSGLQFIPGAHTSEHCLEVQLPFLQRIFTDFEIVPILCGDIDPAALAQILEPYFGIAENLFVISSDLSHYLPASEANRIDHSTITHITNLDLRHSKKLDACGSVPIQTMMQFAKTSGSTIQLLAYSDSGDVSGDKSAVVGYTAMAILR